MDSSFKFKHFSVSNSHSALKVGTDAVLLGAAMTLPRIGRRGGFEAFNSGREIHDSAGAGECSAVNCGCGVSRSEISRSRDSARAGECSAVNCSCGVAGSEISRSRDSARGSELKLLDVGTGTGVIALMAAQRMAGMVCGEVKTIGCERCGEKKKCVEKIEGGDNKMGWVIDAVEIDGPSAEEASENFALSPWASHLRCHNVSLQNFDAGKYDMIFSNPPYYDNSLVNPDAREATARHTDSLSYRDLCAFAAGHLAEDGTLSVILPSEAEKMLLRTAASFGLFPFRILRIKTTERKAPRRIVAEFSRFRPALRHDALRSKPLKTLREETCSSNRISGETLREETLTLQGPEGRTPEYTALTQDFYL